MKAASRLTAPALMFALLWSPHAAHAQDAGDQSQDRDAGHVRGVVVEVNYQRNKIELRTRDGRIIRIRVLPTTSITALGSRNDEYQGIADIHPGDHIEADLSRRLDRYDAQTIEIAAP